MKEIKFVDPSSLARMLAGVFFVMALFIMIPAELVLFIRPFVLGSPITNLLTLPLETLAFTGLVFIGGLIAGYVYNFLATKIGGLEIDITEN